jgi:hypothetical protein
VAVAGVAFHGASSFRSLLAVALKFNKFLVRLSPYSFQLFNGEEKRTLLSDGVVEARNGTGQLLGFEGTAAISIQCAETIAQAAQASGQDDDITVLALTRHGGTINALLVIWTNSRLFGHVEV